MCVYVSYLRLCKKKKRAWFASKQSFGCPRASKLRPSFQRRTMAGYLEEYVIYNDESLASHVRITKECADGAERADCHSSSLSQGPGDSYDRGFDSYAELQLVSI
jgi:hypothetical protein